MHMPGGQLSLFKGKRQRGCRPPAAKEFTTHCMIADTLRRWGNRGWRWTHFPAGEKRSLVTGSRLKRMGVQKGWPDFILLCPYPPRVHFLEIKRAKGAPTNEQQDFQFWCVANEYEYKLAHGYGEALEILKDWGAVKASIGV